jgi:hypothetical protein
VRVRIGGVHGLPVGTLLELVWCGIDGVALVRVSHDEVMRIQTRYLDALP